MIGFGVELGHSIHSWVSLWISDTTVYLKSGGAIWLDVPVQPNLQGLEPV